MICPKCGFNQPEDVYCARCGVHVKKYNQKQRKKTLIILGSVLGLIGGAALFGGRMCREKEARVAIVQAPSPADTEPAKPSAVTEAGRTSPPGKKPLLLRRTESRRKKGVAAAGTRVSVTLQSPAVEFPSHDGAESRSSEEKKTGLSALQWFEQGTALNDDSIAEIACYQKAIELDATFAPAYYRLGAIYFRNAEYELADQAFAHFLGFATGEQKRLYDIYVFYSPAEVENLVAEEGPSDSAVAAKKRGSPDQEKTAIHGLGDNSESTKEHSRDVQTAIPFESLGGHIIVKVLLNREITARMLLDTGAGITVFSDHLAEKINLNAGGAGTVLLNTLTRKVRAPLALAPALQLGSHTKENLPVAICSMHPVRDSFEGILGMDFLRGCTITVDGEANKIILRTAGSQTEETP